METTYRVLRIEEQMYGCEELPAGQPVLCDVTLADPAGERRTLPYPDKELTRLGHRRGQHGRPDRRRHTEKSIKCRRNL